MNGQPSVSYAERRSSDSHADGLSWTAPSGAERHVASVSRLYSLTPVGLASTLSAPVRNNHVEGLNLFVYSDQSNRSKQGRDSRSCQMAQ